MSDPLNFDYFKAIEETVERLYELAKKAREKNLDPSPQPEIALANDLAARVEGLVGPSGVAVAIRQLQEKLEREEVAFQIAKDIVYEKFGNLNDEEAAEQAIRTALAILSGGITAAPLEGIAKVKIKTAADSTRYLSIYFAGPIRAAGGTEAGLTVLVGDFVRSLLHIDKYNPSSDEVERYIEEVDLYKRAVHLQYPSSDEEIRNAVQHLPIEVTGEPTGKVEVSGYRDIPSIETNRVRGGAMLVLNDGLLGKAHKLPKIVKKIGIEGWEWLKNVKELKSKREADASDLKRMTSDKYLANVIAGRPVFAHPSRPGGFRPRYGRARNTGLAAVGIHPATMEILDKFLATGTHVVTERPGKGAIVVPVDTIEGPIIKLTNGTVCFLSNAEEARSYRKDTEKILSLGDMLIAYGEFLENNHPLINAGYCEEWWVLELKDALMKSLHKRDYLCSLLNISNAHLNEFIQCPIFIYPTPIEALSLSKLLNIPLHPRYTYLWHDILPEELNILLEWLVPAKMQFNGEFITEIRASNTNPNSKIILEKLCIPHTLEQNEVVVSYHAPTLAYCLGIRKDVTLDQIRTKLQNSTTIGDSLSIINTLSGIEVRAKAPIFIGGRLGRPEKSKARATSPPVHVLFPIGFDAGRNRNIIELAKKGDVSVDIVRKECQSCHYSSFMNQCPRCGHKTTIVPKCPKCHTESLKNICPSCKTPIRSYEKQVVSLRRLLDEALRKTGVKNIDKVKGVKGLTSKLKQPEILEKGILRSKYGLYVYKDGTTRFDATNAPLSHFKPREIKTSIETLKELGYTHDYMGNPLTIDDQILELKVQDIVIHDECGDYLVNVAKFIDELLVKVYEQPPFYNVTKKEQLVGHLAIGLAPHTSAGVVARIIGFTDAYVCYAHHYFHAAKRRNCDGDEDSVILLLDGLINFSKKLLPEKRGGMMDAPLVLTILLDPHEIDDESYNVDQVTTYPLEFYHKTLDSVDPKEVEDILDIVKHRLDSPAQYAGFRFSHPTSSIAAGPSCTAYKTLDTMEKKVMAQLNLAQKIRAVNTKDVAERVFSHHLLRDIMGCLRKFGMQKVRCTSCNKKYRRIPLSENCPNCGRKLILTVSEGTVTKYLDLAEKIVNGQDLSDYHKQRIILLKKAIESLFEDDTPKQVKLGEYL